ncbi:cytochrome P450 [Novispirillum sp. DQ9]|uniref:cytochrome P450 n=1 Tax=Novispirillum sp. DQ9 TaxID=3398612 RepID=UPI003C7DDBEF
MLRDPDVVEGVLKDGELFHLPSILGYLDMLEARTGESFAAARRMIDHSLAFRQRDEHLAGRRLTAPFFAPKAVDAWRPCAERAVEAVLDTLAEAADPDLVEHFTKPAFTAFVGSLVGLEPRPADDLYDRAQTANQLAHPLLPVADLSAANAAIGALLGRVATTPGHGHGAGAPPTFLAFLAAAPETDRAGIDTVALAVAVVVGSMTLAQFLNLALHGLLRQPTSVWAAVAGPGWAEANLDRILSLYPSGLAMVRTATGTVEIAGCPYHAGETVVMDTAGANAELRREQRQHPDRPQRILSFGAGTHKCPGEPLSRLFLAVALPALARRFPHLALHVDRARFVVSPMLQVPLSLPCERDGRTVRLSARMVEVKSLDAARAIVNDDTFMPPAMEAHLGALAAHSGMDLGPALRIARNAMFFMSGERHAVLRRAVAEHLGGNRLEAWQPRFDAAVEDGLARLAASTAPDLISDFADPVFHGATHDLFGIAPADPDRFNQLAPRLQDVLEPWLPMRELRRLQDLFAGLLDAMRIPAEGEAEGERQSLLGALLAADLPGFDEDDRKAVVLVLYGASFNLAHTLGNVLYWCLSQPEEERDGAGDPAWIDARLEELLSLCASPKYIYRMARDATTVDGHAVSPHDTLRLQLLSINRGTAAGNLAFGHGLHRCVGAALSKRLLRTAVPRLFQRFPRLALLPQRQRFFPMSQTVALSSLPCRLAPPSPT